MNIEQERAEFEAHFSRPPFEWEFHRYGEQSAWPGNYQLYEHQCAWEAWCGRATLQSQKPEPNNLMLSAVIRMPFKMAMADPISRIQFYQRAQQALNELEALQLQDREEVMEMALCESRRLVLRIGQTYRFVPRDGCKACEELKVEHDQAYSIDQARSVEGE